MGDEVAGGLVSRDGEELEEEVELEVAQALAVESGGVLIRGIVRSGPADRAGIAPRDVVLEIDGKPTRDTASLLVRIANLPPGAPVKVKLWREKKAVELDVTVGRRPKAQP